MKRLSSSSSKQKAIFVLLIVVTILILVGILRLSLLKPESADAVSSPITLYRTNTAGTQVSSNPNWLADTQQAPSPYVNAAATGNIVGSTLATINMSHSSVVGSNVPASIFKNWRMDYLNTSAPMQWRFPVSPGEYEVRLYFAESVSANFRSGGRLFDVYIEDGLVEDKLDVYKVAGGPNKAIKRTHYTTVLDSVLIIMYGNRNY